MGMLISGLLKALLDVQLIDAEQAQRITENAASSNNDVADYIFHNSIVDSEAVATACAQYFGLVYNPQEWLDNPSLSEQIIYYSQHGRPAAALYNPRYLHTVKKNIPICIISANRFFNIRHRLASNTIASNPDEHTATEKLNGLLHQALNQRASDIHLEPFHDDYHIRLRTDGLLHHHKKLSHALCKRILTRLKVLSKTDMTQTRLPQDGRFTFKDSTHECDCRISFCPTIWGEKCVIRLLESNKKILQFDELGLTTKDKQTLLQAIHNPQGLILVTGPTGSGKTQTLYTILNYLNQAHLNISTLEDPVEIKLSGINQIHIDESIGLSFATVLRSLLRQDPDIIMIGEIRDTQTAELAIRAAHTGHLVLATLHTQNAIEAITRLKNLRIKCDHIASTLKLVIAQRLIRRLDNNTLMGRTGLFEMLPISPPLQHMIAENSTSLALKKWATHYGYTPLYQAGMTKVTQHETTLDELKRVINFDEAQYVH